MTTLSFVGLVIVSFFGVFGMLAVMASPVALVGMMFHWFRDMPVIEARKARCRAAGKEFVWATGGGWLSEPQCNCSRCNCWTPLHGGCRHCGTSKP